MSPVGQERERGIWCKDIELLRSKVGRRISMNFIKWYVLYLYGLVLKQYSTPFPLGEDAENTFLQTLNPLYHADTDI